MRWVTAATTGFSFMAVPRVAGMLPRCTFLGVARRYEPVTNFLDVRGSARVVLRERCIEATAGSRGPAADRPGRMGRGRRSLGLRLWLADLAARVRLRGASPGPRARLAPGAEDVEPHQPRHARTAGPGVRPALGRLLPGRGLPHPARRGRGRAGTAVAARDEDGGVRPALAAGRHAPGAGAPPGGLRPDTPQGRVRALAFTLSRKSPNHTGELSEEEYRTIFAGASGISGTTLDYAHRTLEELKRHDIHDRNLENLLRLVRGHGVRREPRES